MKGKTQSTTKLFKVYRRLKFNRCFLCNIKSDDHICTNCLNGIEENLTYCCRCKLPTAVMLDVCGQCQAQPPLYNELIAPYLYQGVVKTLILQLKFNDTTYNTQILSLLLAQKLRKHYQNKETPSEQTNTWPEMLIYVPSHTKRVRERGFCHMKLLAKRLATFLPDTIELNHSLLKKQFHLEPQHQKKRENRLKIKSNSYVVMSRPPKHIALLDDVITTGATINACVKILKKAGAERVDVWSFARTPPPNYEEDLE